MPRLRWYDHLSINLFWLGLNIRNQAVGSLFLPFLVDIFARPEVKNTALGGLRTAGLIVAMLVQPAAGLLSDRSTSRFGRRRPYIFVGVLLDLVFLAAIYFSWSYLSLVAALLLLQLSSNISHGPLQGLIPDLVPEDQRGVSSGLKAIFELLPILLVGMAIAGLVGQGHLDWAMLVTGALLLGIMLLTMFLVKEPPLREKINAPFWPPMMRVLGMLAGILLGALAGLAGGGLAGGLAGLLVWPLGGAQNARIVGVSLGGLVAMVLAVGFGVRAGVRITLGTGANHIDAESGQAGIPARVNQPATPDGQDSFSWWVINRLLFLAAITSIQGFAPYFLMYAFKIGREPATSMTGQLMTMVGAFTLVTALPGGWLSDRYGHKRLIGLSGFGAALGSFLLLGSIWAPNLELIYTAGAVLGLATGLFMTANWALGTGLVPPAEAGRYLGVSNLAGAGAGMIGSGIGGPVADYLNTIIPGLGYFILFACYGILFLLSAASLRGIHGFAPSRRVPEELPAPID
jgi:MFS family permease